ncbi:MAG TPA: DNA topoisomerase, partial [Candidatus Omnitrophota bacterium]|nr:DNA topoisomerase [Candidatus Omnitrophota bacterium]
MPVRKRKPKSREQVTAEQYFPVSKSDLKHAVGKENTSDYHELISETKKKPKAKTKAKVSTAKKSTRARKPVEEFKPQEIKLKKGGYELIITEKPQAAAKIASSLGKSSTRTVNGVKYFEVDRQGKKLYVACAAGHLFTLAQKTPGSGTPVFDLHWVPNYMAIKNDFTKKFYDVILKLAKGAGALTIATDYDIEGEVIGLNIIRYICGQPDANRMKYSTLTTAELNTSYENKTHSLDWGQAIAGQTRHYLDWIYGINLSRALMDAIKTTGKFRIMSIGRVQGPTLKLIVDKEREINKFKSEKYWQTFITIKNGEEIELKYTKDIFDKKLLDKFKDLKGKDAE